MTEVDDVDGAVLGNYYIRRALELLQPVASVANHAEQFPCLREDLDSGVVKVGHIDATSGSNRDAGCDTEPSGPPTREAERTTPLSAKASRGGWLGQWDSGERRFR